MALTETIDDEGHKIAHQLIEVEYGIKMTKANRFTVYRPANGDRLAQKMTLPEAKMAIDDDLASGGE